MKFTESGVLCITLTYDDGSGSILLYYQCDDPTNLTVPTGHDIVKGVSILRNSSATLSGLQAFGSLGGVFYGSLYYQLTDKSFLATESSGISGFNAFNIMNYRVNATIGQMCLTVSSGSSQYGLRLSVLFIPFHRPHLAIYLLFIFLLSISPLFFSACTSYLLGNSDSGRNLSPAINCRPESDPVTTPSSPIQSFARNDDPYLANEAFYDSFIAFTGYSNVLLLPSPSSHLYVYFLSPHLPHLFSFHVPVPVLFRSLFFYSSFLSFPISFFFLFLSPFFPSLCPHRSLF